MVFYIFHFLYLYFVYLGFSFKKPQITIICISVKQLPISCALHPASIMSKYHGEHKLFLSVSVWSVFPPNVQDLFLLFTPVVFFMSFYLLRRLTWELMNQIKNPDFTFNHSISIETPCAECGMQEFQLYNLCRLCPYLSCGNFAKATCPTDHKARLH